SQPLQRPRRRRTRRRVGSSTSKDEFLLRATVEELRRRKTLGPPGITHRQGSRPLQTKSLAALGAIIIRLTFCSQRMSRVPAEFRCAFDAAFPSSWPCC